MIVVVPLVIGFDLDMTLLDTRAGIAATFHEVVARTGVHVDVDLVVTRLGPPLRHELAEWFPPADVEAAVTLYRSLYPSHAIAPTVELPGAREALAAVRDAGGRVAVITSKLGRLAELHLSHAGLDVDEVHGDVFAEEKGAVLRTIGAQAMVGDHVADIRAGVVAGVHPIGVASGPCSREDLLSAGAETVLPDLCAFPAWLHGAISVGPAQRDD
jgi:phosphoglycolate phosphatase